MTAADFLSTFPEFNDPVVYPVPRINFWLSIAMQVVSQKRWGTLYSQGLALYTAHSITIDGMRGVVEGLDTTQSVDGVSYTTDIASITNKDAGYFNKSWYGIQYYTLAQQLGAGPIQLTGFFTIT